MENEVRKDATEVWSHLSAAQQRAYSQSWANIELGVRERQPRGAKVFEVHHAIEHARTLFFKDMIAGHNPDQCERNAKGE